MKKLVERPLTCLNRMEVRERALRGVETLLQCTPFEQEEKSLMESVRKLLSERLELRPDFEMTKDEEESAII